MNNLDHNTAILLAQAVVILAAIWKATTWLAARVEKIADTQGKHDTKLAVHEERLDTLDELHKHCPTAHEIRAGAPAFHMRKEQR